MNASKRRLIGIGIFTGAIVSSAILQVFGNGLVVVTQLPSSTPNDAVVKGVNMAG
jgi:hypothetical protein